MLEVLKKLATLRRRGARELLRAVLRRLPRRASASCQHPLSADVLVRDPLTVLTFTSPDLPLGVASAIGREVADVPTLFLLALSWHVETMNLAVRLDREIRRHTLEFPAHRIIVLCNSDVEARVLTSLGAPAVVINHNICIPTDVFRPLGAPRKYDAVHVARMTPWKRHVLANEIPSVVHVFTREATLGWRETLAYLEEMQCRMPSHSFLNRINGEEFEAISRVEVNTVLNQAHVGLCLSAEEGAMFASMEYLLAGLPVVSTTSLGGRDHFFDPDYCLVVPPDARAVRDAVDTLTERGIPAGQIRESTLFKIERERARFLDLLRREAPGGATEIEVAQSRGDRFFSGLYQWRPREDIGPLLARLDLTARSHGDASR